MKDLCPVDQVAGQRKNVNDVFHFCPVQLEFMQIKVSLIVMPS
ncbi:hypothetical protein ACNVED_10495 [Legionella sp. D16C41]